MSGMNQALAAMYNTLGAGDAAQEETTKIAHMELFANAAAANGLDLASMDASTRQELFAEFSKLASDDGDEDDEGGDSDSEDDEEEAPAVKKEAPEPEKEKEAAARAEFAKQVEWQEKLAQADHLGRRMAHSFWQEYTAISKEAAASLEGTDKEAASLEGLKNFGKQLSGSKVRAAGSKLETLKGQASNAKDMGLTAAKKAREGKIGETAKTLAEETGKTRKARMIAGGAAAGAAGAGAAAAAMGKKKEASVSSFDLLAAEEAVKLAHSANYDAEEAAELLNAVLTLGPAATEKVAHAGNNYEQALSIRALELLEQASYPVNWAAVFPE